MIRALKQSRFVPLTCRQHLDELNRVLGYPRITRRYHISRRNRRRLVTSIYLRSVWVDVAGDLAICRDPNDNYLIEIAIVGGATHLVTEDKDICEDEAVVTLLAEIGVQVCSAAEFNAIIQG